MAIMLTGVSVPQSAPKGTLVGVLHWYGSGAPVASNFVLGHACRFGPHKPVEPDADASDPGGDGLVAIDGDKLVTAAAMLSVGFYALTIGAVAYVGGVLARPARSWSR